MLKTKNIRIMLEKKIMKWFLDHSTQNFLAVLFYMFDIFWILFIFLMSFFKVKILENGCSSHTFLKYDIIWHHMISYDIIWYHMISYDIIWYHMTSYDIIWRHMISYDIIKHHMMSYDVIWYHMMSHDVIWCHKKS